MLTKSLCGELICYSVLEKSGVTREEIFLTTKVWIEHYGYEQTKASVYESMLKLKVNYIDLVLLHQPFGNYYGAWRALEDLYADGKIRAIGISNFYPDRMVDLASFSRIRPMVEFYYIMTAADDTKAAMETTLACFRGYADCVEGAKERGIIYGTGVYEKGKIKDTPAMQEAYKAGKKV